MTTINGKDAEPTAPKQQIGRPFKPGQSGNPAGRPKGSRNKLCGQFFDDLLEAWQEHGQEALRQLAADSPKDFCKLAGMVIPKEIELDVSGQVELFTNVENFRQAYQLALQHIGAKPPLLEAEDLELTG